MEVAKAVIYLTSEMAMKVTGHVMHVDGGKTLTSKGQQDWYGSGIMNRKFEQDTLSYYAHKFSTNKAEPRKPTNNDELYDWVKDRQTSVWNGTEEELHIKVTADYSNQIEDKDEQANLYELNKDPTTA